MTFGDLTAISVNGEVSYQSMMLNAEADPIQVLVDIETGGFSRPGLCGLPYDLYQKSVLISALRSDGTC